MGAGCPGALAVDFLVAVRGGWLGMIIRLWPVTGVDTDGVVVAELLKVPEPWGARREKPQSQQQEPLGHQVEQGRG